MIVVMGIWIVKLKYNANYILLYTDELLSFDKAIDALLAAGDIRHGQFLLPLTADQIAHPVSESMVRAKAGINVPLTLLLAVLNR